MTKTPFILLTALCLGLLAAAPEAQARPIELDGYAAIVNGRVVTIGEVLSLLEPVQAQLRERYEGDELQEKMNEAYKESLDALVERALILEEFKAQGGNLPDRAVDDQINAMINDRFKNDRAAFLKALAEERMTLDDWRDETRDRLIVTLMRRREVVEKAVVPPRDVVNLYQERVDQFRSPAQVHLRVIVLQKGASAADADVKRQEAEQIRAKVAGGTDFADEAKAVSEGNKKAEGGDLGWLEAKELRPELQKAVAALDVGGISPVVDTGDEFYLVKLEGRKDAAVTPFEDVRDKLDEELKKAEEERLYKAWIERLKKKFYVKILAGEPEAAGARPGPWAQ